MQCMLDRLQALTQQRKKLRNIIVAVCIALMTLSAAAGAAKRPNILLIITDQQYAGDMGAAGNTHVKTPAMDSLAARGTRFERSYCTYPICSPARASLETSRMPHELNIFNNHRAIIPDSVPTMGEIFRKAGYRTAWAGKWHVPVPYPAFGGSKFQPRGFEVLPLDAPKHRSNPNVGPGMGSDPATVKAAVKFLSEPQAQPFLLTVSLLNPHDICDYPKSPDKYPKPAPTDPLPPLPANFNATNNEPSSLQTGRARKSSPGADFANYGAKEWQTYRWVYFRLIETVDAHIATVLDALEKSGQAENTLIIFTADHGEMAGAHQLGTKLQMYEEAARVPLIVCVPGTTNRLAVDNTHLVSGLDILPTLCDYAGIPPVSSFGGSSLRPLLEHWNRRAPVSWRDHLVVEMGDTELVRMVRSERYKYVVYASSSDPEMLFDMNADPHETRNLARDPSMKSVIASHRALLKEWIAKTNDKFLFPRGIY
jgi:arylsulfatase A-like enzyme